jgi:hypothetical protein
MVRALEARQAQTAVLVESARQMQTSLEVLRSRAERVLDYLPAGLPTPPGEEAWRQKVLHYLTQRQGNGTREDCPLPELYRQARQEAGALSIGGFHDGLRQLHAGGLIYLHPWTGPLYALPEPPLALLVGHEIAYYASPRKLAA